MTTVIYTPSGWVPLAGAPVGPGPDPEDPNQPPTAPVSLNVAPSGATVAVVSWLPATDPDGTVAQYEVSVNGEVDGVTAGLNRTLTNLTPEATYTVTVRARDNDGDWGPNATRTVTMPADEVLPTPTFTHGEDIPALSGDAAAVIGPHGALTPWTGSTTFSGTQTISNRIFSSARIAAGANITFKNCRFTGWAGQASYTINATAGGGLKVTLEDCEVIAQSLTSSTPRCVTMWGDGNVEARRTIFRGGIDNLYLNPAGTQGAIATGDPDTPYARVLIEDCWLGEILRVPASHSDPVQIDGGGYVVFRRSRLMGYSLDTLDPNTDRITDVWSATLSGGGFICTQNSSALSLITNVRLRDSWFEGGNYTVDLNPPENPTQNCSATNNKFGRRHRFGVLRTSSGGTATSNNVWGQSGTTPDRTNPITVTAGEPV